MKIYRINHILELLLLPMFFVLLVACSPQTGKPTRTAEQQIELSTPQQTQIVLATIASQPVLPTIVETPTQEPPQASFNPCDYLTPEEITSVIDQKIVKAVPSDTPRPNCHYVTETDANGYNASIVVYVFTGFSAAGAFEIGKTEQDTNPETVTGVGDDAYWSPSLDNLNVLYKDIYFTVQFLGTENQTVDLAKELALMVIANMEEKGVPN